MGARGAACRLGRLALGRALALARSTVPDVPHKLALLRLGMGSPRGRSLRLGMGSPRGRSLRLGKGSPHRLGKGSPHRLGKGSPRGLLHGRWQGERRGHAAREDLGRTVDGTTVATRTTRLPRRCRPGRAVVGVRGPTGPGGGRGRRRGPRRDASRLGWGLSEPAHHDAGQGAACSAEQRAVGMPAVEIDGRTRR